jgi:hypothetical protein
MSELIAAIQIPHALIRLAVTARVGVVLEMMADVPRLTKIDDGGQRRLSGVRSGILGA